MMNYSTEGTTFQEEIYSITPKPVVVLNKSWEQLNDPERILLDKILRLSQVTIQHVQIISNDKIDFSQWSQKPKKVIAFGLNTTGLPTNEILEVNGASIIVTQDLVTLENAEKETKQKLAVAVKELLNS